MAPRLRLLDGPWVSLQDGGRSGHARHGVGPGGPMDRLAHLLAVRLAGVAQADVADATAVEVGPGGARFRLEGGALDLALAGPGAVLHHDGEALPAPVVARVAAGEQFAVRGSARWAVVAPRGRLAVTPVLGSTSRHGRADLGPVWREGTAVAVDTAGVPAVRRGTRGEPSRPGGPLRLLPAPQTHRFPPAERDRLVAGGATLGARGDRMAHRIDGVVLHAEGGHDIVSDAVVAGTLQVQGDGAPWVLLAEHQPTGGYPKVAVLAAADLARLVQLAPGTPLDLAWGTVGAARRRWADAVEAIERCVAGPPRPTADALRRAPVSGAVATGETATG